MAMTQTMNYDNDFRRRATLNADAPLYVPAAYREAEDFSPEWWHLVQTCPAFRQQWMQDYSRLELAIHLVDLLHQSSMQSRDKSNPDLDDDGLKQYKLSLRRSDWSGLMSAQRRRLAGAGSAANLSISNRRCRRRNAMSRTNGCRLTASKVIQQPRR